MTGRTTESVITFKHPFMLNDFDRPEPEGTYRLIVEEQEIPGISFLAFGRTRTTLFLPAIGITGRKIESYEVNSSELADALAADQAKGQ